MYAFNQTNEYDQYDHTFHRSFSPNEERLFLQLIKIQSETYHVKDMYDFLLSLLKANEKRHGLTIEVHEQNILVRKGSSSDTALHYPAIACHTDTVHKILPIKDYRVMIDPFSSGTASRQFFSTTGIGGDDKCGIFIALSALFSRRVSHLKVMFFKDEERGSQGARQVVKDKPEWFSDISYILEPDRRGSSDIITAHGGDDSCSPDFKKILVDEGLKKPFSFKPATGSTTDVMAIQKDIGISVANISCGYYLPHSADEFIDESDLLKSRDFILHLIQTIPIKRWTFTPPERVVSYTTYWDRQRKANDEVRRTTWIDENGFVYDVEVTRRKGTDYTTITLTNERGISSSFWTHFSATDRVVFQYWLFVEMGWIDDVDEERIVSGFVGPTEEHDVTMGIDTIKGG